MTELISFGLGARWTRHLWARLDAIRNSQAETFDAIHNTITRQDPLEIARYYIEPDCQERNPREPLDPHRFVPKQPVMQRMDAFFQTDSPGAASRRMVVFSEAGMGKTALLTLLKLMHLADYWPQNTDCVLLKLGADTLKTLKQVEDPPQTILLLDGLDEDPLAFGRGRVRLSEILRASRDFKRVVISCKSGFCPEMDADMDKEDAVIRVDGLPCAVSFLCCFTEQQVHDYLNKRFPMDPFYGRHNRAKRNQAGCFVEKMGYLRCHPLLLSYIDALMAAPFIDERHSPYQVYEALVQSLLIREKRKNPKLSKKGLMDACVILATLMQSRHQHRISPDELAAQIDACPALLPLKQLWYKSRSLIHRSPNGDYLFSHYTIQEFCVARLLLEKPFFRPHGLIRLTDFIFELMVKSGLTPHYSELFDCRNLNLKGAELPDFQLAGAELSGMDLSNSVWVRADLKGADLRDADLRGADFSGADLAEADLRGSLIDRTNFNGAGIRAARFDWAIALTNSLGMAFAYIPPGRFMMGSPPDEPARNHDERPHEVILSRGFYMQVTPVTQKQWMAVMGANPSGFADRGGACPVENVSWDEAVRFIEKLNRSGEPYQYSLPTEAQWEYACRAGSLMPFWTGPCIDSDQANYDGNHPLAGCPLGAYRQQTTPVKTFEPNPWGLHDMHGNVWEWCADWFGEYPEGPVTDPTGPSDGAGRVIRGGSWNHPAAYCRAAFRDGHTPEDRNSCLGFRVLMAGPSR